MSDVKGHSHSHAHSHEHSHTHGDGKDMWEGIDYLSRPGINEASAISARTVIYALSSAGVSESQMNGMNVLEIGCGPGLVTTHLLSHFDNIHSIDTSPHMIKTFLEIHRDDVSPPNPKLHVNLHELSKSSCENTEIFPEKFDVAIANAVLHHVDNLDGFMEGVVSILNDGGWVVFTEIGKEAFEHDGKTTQSGSVNAPDHYHPALEPEQLVSLLTRHGLVDIHTEYKGTIPVFGVGNNEPPQLLIRGKKGA